MVKCNRDQVKRLQKVVRREKDPSVHQRIQMVLLREDGKTQPKIAELTGVSLSTVNRAHMYDNGGVNALKPKPTDGRRRENMTLEEEKAFLRRRFIATRLDAIREVQEIGFQVCRIVGRTRLEPHRTGLFETQILPAQGAGASRRGPLAAHWRTPGSLSSERMRQLFQKRRICFNVKQSCSSGCHATMFFAPPYFRTCKPIASSACR
jgi:transposase